RRWPGQGGGVRRAARGFRRRRPGRRAGRASGDAAAGAPAAPAHSRGRRAPAHDHRQAAAPSAATAGDTVTVQHTSTMQVRWGDVDAAGIVFYPRFYEWYDYGCESLFASLGLPWPETFPRYGIVGVPILESGSRFPSPARYGDTLAIRAT